MCIRDRVIYGQAGLLVETGQIIKLFLLLFFGSVSSTHLTLPTILRVYVWVVAGFFQAEDGIRGLVRSRGLGDVYKRQGDLWTGWPFGGDWTDNKTLFAFVFWVCLFYTSDAADDLTRVCLGGRWIFSSRRRHTRSSTVSWARRCV